MTEHYQKKFKLEEMAHAGNVGQLSIDVYTDHNPPHFHVTKKDEFEVKISIKNFKIIDYKWQKNNKEISSKELKDLIKWIHTPYHKNKKVTNLEAIQMFWDSMN